MDIILFTEYNLNGLTRVLGVFGIAAMAEVDPILSKICSWLLTFIQSVCAFYDGRPILIILSLSNVLDECGSATGSATNIPLPSSTIYKTKCLSCTSTHL